MTRATAPRRRAADALDAVRAHPRHVVLFALVTGLLAGAWVPAAAPALAVAAGALAPSRTIAIAAAAAVLGGAAGSALRSAAILGADPPARLGSVVALDVTLLERFRERSSGERVASARTASGARVLLRGGRLAAAGGTRGEPVAAPPGTVLRVRGEVEPLRAFETIHRRRGTAAAIAVIGMTAVGHRAGFAGLLDRVRGRAERALSAGLPPSEAALLRGMVLGQDEAIGREVREDFEVSGLAHILAVSGTNVMLLCALAFGCCALAGIPLRPRLAIALGLIAVYVPLTGAAPSIQRAGVMGAAGIVATLASRPQSRWYALGLAAALTLALNPFAAAEPGWQLSFAAVVGLIALAPGLRRAMSSRGVPKAVAEVAAMTVAATVMTAPLLAAHFGRVSLVSLPANLLAAPVVAPMMWLGMLAAAAGQIAAALARRARATGSGGQHGLPARARAPVAAGAVAIILMALLAPGPGPPEIRPGETLVSFLDVGQGDATLVRGDGASVLVDTGPPDGPVLDRLAREGVHRLDALIITHAQSDHEGAALAVIDRLRPRLVVNGGAGWPSPVQGGLAARARAAGARVHVPAAGERLRLGSLVLHVLWPSAEVRDRPPLGDPNDRAVVAHLSSGDFDLLLPADAESSVTAPLPLRPVEALKVAHHGSADEGLPDLLRRIRPRFAAIEVGRGNRYGHPHPGTLAALRSVEHVVRTDRDGTVRLRTDGRRITVERAGGLR